MNVPVPGSISSYTQWLRENRDLAVSLIYEEFCLLEEAGEDPSREQFCQRYAPWRDSLEIQLTCHHELSKLAKPRAFRHAATAVRRLLERLPN